MQFELAPPVVVKDSDQSVPMEYTPRENRVYHPYPKSLTTFSHSLGSFHPWDFLQRCETVTVIAQCLDHSAIGAAPLTL